MPASVGVPRETEPGERRVALVPAMAAKLLAAGLNVIMERGAGFPSMYPDAEYEGVRLEQHARAVWQADIVLKVQPPSLPEVRLLREDGVLIGAMAPYAHPERTLALRDRGATVFSMELLPRLTRAQAMDVLSSQASLTGQKAVLLAATALPRLMPMMTIAVGTTRPAKVVVLGAGVAGLQAVATAYRLGAVVEAYDVRAATREQVESLGGRFIDTGVVAEGEGGYARELTAEERRRQQEVLDEHIAAADAVITTAAVPGKRAPILIPAALVERMRLGSVIVDLGAESGGNCELSQPGETITAHGVTIIAPLNLASTMAWQASDYFAKNLLHFLLPMIHDGVFAPDWENEIVAGTLLARGGAIVQESIRLALEGAASTDAAPSSGQPGIPGEVQP